MIFPESADQFLVTAIMPALNEELCLDASVANVLDVFEKFNINGEIVIVNDGSRDRTGAMADTWADKHDCIRAIHHRGCRGIGAAFWSGVQQARGEIVLFIPGDGENDAAEIFRYLPLLDHVDIVVPFVYNPEVRSRFRQSLSTLYTRVVCISFGLTLNYLNGTVMYRKAILNGIELQSTGFFYQAELLIKAIRRRYLYAEVPYALKQRNAGGSKAVSPFTLIKVFRAYAKIFTAVHFCQPEPHAICRVSATYRRLGERTSDNKERSSKDASS